MRTLALFLVLGVVAPTAAVLWFMNDAARSQAESARQNVTEAYRGQMRLLRDRVDEFWRERAGPLAAGQGLPAALKAAGADAAVFLDESGSIVYPAPAPMFTADPLPDRDDWAAAQALETQRRLPDAAAAYERLARGETDAATAARAAQAQVRCLVAAGRREAALRAIESRFGSGAAARGHDLQGRWIAADEQLLGLKLAGRDEAAARRFASRLAAWLNDYDNVEIPSAQRVFLMRALREAAPSTPPFPYFEAESLALEFAALPRPREAGEALQPSGVRGVWKLSASSGRAIALYRTESIIRDAARVLGPAQNAVFSLAPVGKSGGMDATPAGAMMPGWQLSYSLVDRSAIDQEARRRTGAYLWIGYGAAAVVALAGIAAAGAFGRQLQLARLKTDLVAAVSHELKTPLSSMRLLVDSLLEDGAGDEKKTREYLELIAGENARLSRLIENFLTFSRLERRRQRFDFAKVPPARVVQDAMAALRERAPGAQVEVDVPDGLPEIEADADAVVTALLNLLENAQKYTGAEKRIALRVAADGRGVNFFVQDNGIGIAPAEQKRIFRRFYRVDQRLARDTGGCGLGLSIVDGIVRAHGGHVEVKSVLGEGSTFRVWLPKEVKA